MPRLLENLAVGALAPWHAIPLSLSLSPSLGSAFFYAECILGQSSPHTMVKIQQELLWGFTCSHPGSPKGNSLFPNNYAQVGKGQLLLVYLELFYRPSSQGNRMFWLSRPGSHVSLQMEDEVSCPHTCWPNVGRRLFPERMVELLSEDREKRSDRKKWEDDHLQIGLAGPHCE